MFQILKDATKYLDKRPLTAVENKVYSTGKYYSKYISKVTLSINNATKIWYNNERLVLRKQIWVYVIFKSWDASKQSVYTCLESQVKIKYFAWLFLIEIFHVRKYDWIGRGINLIKLR